MNASEARELVQKKVEQVSAETGVPAHDILGERHLPHIVAARHLAIYRIRQEGFSYPQIGRFMQLHHTSAMHAVRKMQARLAA